MKTSTNTLSKIASLRWLSQLNVGYRSLLLLSILVTLLIAACHQPATEPLPAKPDTGSKPGSSTITQPGDSTTTTPGNSTTTQPGNSTTTQPGNSTTTQPGDSVRVYKKLRISWSANDFQEILYNAAGLPVQYASQYVNNQGTGHIQRYVYKLHYNPEKQLKRVDVTHEAGSTAILYQYKGNQVTQTNEYTADGGLLSTSTYQYSSLNRLSQVDEQSARGVATRRTYQYDAKGNLSVLSIYGKDAALGTYVLNFTISYGEYDTQYDVENLLFHSPMLPGVTFRTNNHRLKIVRDRDGKELSRERFTYTYTDQGYPTQQIRTGPGGSLTATYSY